MSLRHFAAVLLGTYGDVVPLLPYFTNWINDGIADKVTILISSSKQAPFLLARSTPTIRIFAISGGIVGDASKSTASQELNEIFGELACLPSVDLLLFNLWSVGAYHVAEALRCPYCVLSAAPSPPMLDMPAAASHEDVLRLMSCSVLAPHYVEWRCSMGMERLLPDFTLKHAIINSSSALVMGPPALLRLCVGFAGPDHGAEGGRVSLSPSQIGVTPLHSEYSTVMVTFGSMASLGIAFSTDMQLELVSELTQQCKVRCILHLPATPEDFDAAIRRHSAVPFQLLVGEVEHDRVLSSCDVIIHHGGAGTCHTAALAGVAQVVVAHAFDQFAWASRIQELGVGFACDRTDNVATIIAAAKAAIALRREKPAAIDRIRENIREEAPTQAATEIVMCAMRDTH